MAGLSEKAAASIPRRSQVGSKSRFARESTEKGIKRRTMRRRKGEGGGGESRVVDKTDYPERRQRRRGAPWRARAKNEMARDPRRCLNNPFP